MFASRLLLLASGALSLVSAQLIGPVGPITPLQYKNHECSILDYGAVADNKTDVSDAIHLAFELCVKPHPASRLVIPQGHYLLEKTVVLENATNWALQVDGLITAKYGGNWTVDRAAVLQGLAGVQPLNSTINGEGDNLFLLDIFVIINAVDFEFYSSNGRGAFQGQGYLYRNANNTVRPRLVRLVSPVNASVHDLLLIDSPKFHFVFDFGVNLEVYHLTIRGANLGSFDGIDAIGTNYWVHDNEVTNRDECVSVKNPSHWALVSNNVCNRVGSGVSIGSLNVSADISNIHVVNISVYAPSEISFIKTFPGGSGLVSNITFENFRTKGTNDTLSGFGLNVDEYWQNTHEPNDGSVALRNITFRNYTGSVYNGTKYAVIRTIASNLTDAIDITIEDFSVWTEVGNYVVNQISNFFGTGDNVYGPNNGISSLPPGATPTSYTTNITITASPTGWVKPGVPTWAVGSTGYGTASPIPVYTPAPLWDVNAVDGDYNKHYWGSF